MYAKGTDRGEREKVMMREGGGRGGDLHLQVGKNRKSHMNKGRLLTQSTGKMAENRAQKQVGGSLYKLSSDCFCFLSELGSKIIC